MSIVYNTLAKLEEKLGNNIHPEAMIHSDQGFHYTHPEFQKRVKQMNLNNLCHVEGTVSIMPPMESFFGHMKDEMDYKESSYI